MKFSQGKGKLRSRSERLKTIGLDSVGIETQRCLLRKFHRHVTGIKCDCHTFILAALFFNIISQTLRCLGHRIHIHPVGSSSDHAAKSTCSKGKIFVKTILDFFFISCNGRKFGLRLLIKNRILTPLFIFCFIIHAYSPLALLHILYSNSVLPCSCKVSTTFFTSCTRSLLHTKTASSVSTTTRLSTPMVAIIFPVEKEIVFVVSMFT